MEYGAKFFRRRVKKYREAELLFAQIIFDYLKPKSVVDVGCAIGSYLEGFYKCGIKLRRLCGYEKYARTARKYMAESIKNIVHETDATVLRAPRTRYDLVMCVEVAEHIASEYSTTLVKNLAGLKNKNGVIFFTAAPPGQRGTGHINCQPPEFWHEIFAENGLHLDKKMTDGLSNLLKSTGFLPHIPKNLMIYH